MNLHARDPVARNTLEFNDVGGGRLHSDPYPLPWPSTCSFKDRSPYQKFCPSDLRELGLSKRGLGKMSEAVDSLNALSCSMPVDIRRTSDFFSGLRASGPATTTQRSVISNVIDSIHGYGSCPDGSTPRGCFEEVLKSKDMYSLGQKNLAPFNQDLLKVLKSETIPKPAAQLLPPARRFAGGARKAHRTFIT